MQTTTYSSTQSWTHAQHVASKVAADLKRIQRIYRKGIPSDYWINNFQREAALLLDKGYLDSVTYGFKKNSRWVFALKYRVTGGDLVGVGDDPGGIRPVFNVTESNFTSFLSYSPSWALLTPKAREIFKKQLPFERGYGVEPGIENGHWVEDRSYLSGELGVKRLMIERN